MLEALLTGLTPDIVLTFQEPIHPTRLKPQRLQIILTTAPLLDNGVYSMLRDCFVLHYGLNKAMFWGWG